MHPIEKHLGSIGTLAHHCPNYNLRWLEDCSDPKDQPPEKEK